MRYKCNLRKTFFYIAKLRVTILDGQGENRSFEWTGTCFEPGSSPLWVGVRNMVVNEQGSLTFGVGTVKTVVEKENAKFPKGDQANYDLSHVQQRLDVITEAQLAKMLGVKVQTLAVWRTENRGPAYIKPTSKTVLYKLEHVDQWFSCNVVETNRTLKGSE